MIDNQAALTWREIGERTRNDRQPHESVYDWCWVCGQRLGPDKMHVLIDNGRVMRHTYCCRRHRYVSVMVAAKIIEDGGATTVPQFVIQERTDLEIESLASAFKAGELKPGWE